MSRQLLKKIDAIRRQAVLFVWARAVCLSLACLSLVLVSLVLLDLAIRSDAVATRWLWMGGLVVACGFALAKWVLPVFNYRPRRVDIARRIEEQNGDWKNELTTSVQLAGQLRESRDVPNRLEADLIERSLGRLGRKSALAHFNPGSLASPTLWLMIASAIGSLVMATQKPDVLHSLKRIATPWSSADWPKANEIVVEPVPSQIPRGGSLFLQAFDQNNRLVDAPCVEIRSSAGLSAMEMTEVDGAPGRFAARINNVQEELQLRVTGGDDQSEWYSVRVFDKPAVISSRMWWSHPEYEQGQPQEITESFECWAGAELFIEGLASTPLSAATFVIQNGTTVQRNNLLTANGGTRFKSENLVPKLTEEGTCFLELTGMDSAHSVETLQYSFSILVDQPPKVNVKASDKLVGPRSEVELQAVVFDEKMVTEADLLVYQGRVLESNLRKTVGIELSRGQDPEPGLQIGEAIVTLDVSEIENVPTGDRLLLVVRARDVIGNEARSEYLDLEVVSLKRLEEMASQFADQLARQLNDVQTRQSVLNARTQRLTNESSAFAQLQQIVSEQRRILRLYDATDRSATGLTRALSDFAIRHRMEWSGLESIETILEIQRELSRQIQPDLQRLLASIDRQLELFAGNDQYDVKARELPVVQQRFLAGISQMTALLRLSADFEEVAELVATLSEEQAVVFLDSQEVQRQLISEAIRDARPEIDQLVTRQSRLRALTEQLSRQLETIAGESAEKGVPNRQLLKDVRAILESEGLLREMLQAETALADGQVGTSLESQQRSIHTLQRMVAILMPESGLSAGDADGNGIENRIADLIRQLSDLESRLDDHAASPSPMDDQVRQQLDSRKEELRQQLLDLQNAVQASRFQNLGELIRNAIERFDSAASSVDPQGIEQESRKIQQAIQQLQIASLEIARSTQPEAGENTDLTKILSLMSQLLEAQRSVNQWTGSQEDGNPPAQSSDLISITELQKQIQAGFDSVATRLQKYPTAVILTGSVSRRMGLSIARIQELRFDDETSRIQELIVDELQQLIEAIEIQLESSQGTSEVESSESENDDQPASPGISSFELTMLYVMQNRLQRETGQWMIRWSEAGEETELLQQERRELVARQQEVAEVLTQLLDETRETIPSLPDF